MGSIARRGVIFTATATRCRFALLICPALIVEGPIRSTEAAWVGMPEGDPCGFWHLAVAIRVTAEADPIVVDSRAGHGDGVGYRLCPVIAVGGVVCPGELGNRHIASRKGYMTFHAGHLGGTSLGQAAGGTIVSRTVWSPACSGVGVAGLTLASGCTGVTVVVGGDGVCRMAVDARTAIGQRTATVDPLLVGEVYKNASFVGVEGVTSAAGVMDRGVG